MACKLQGNREFCSRIVATNMISAITVTYGRVKWLEEAIGDMLAQDYKGEWELLIANTFQRQRLAFNDPHVRILNLKHRPETLGHARNMAVAAAKADRIVICDDDDRYLPHFLSTFANNWPDGLDWVWLDKRFCAHGPDIHEISFGCHGGCFGFTKRVWEAVGGYPDLTVGEDRVLVNKITKYPGKRITLGDSMPPFICCWGNGAWHVSGGGDDHPGTPGAHTRAEAALQRRIGNGEEKSGDIVLKPKTDGSWLKKAEVFMAAELKKNSMNDVCVVELGRYGDIINILPILLHIHNEFGTPTLMVSREFADLLDGVSYVKPHVVDLRNDQLEAAMKLARGQYRNVLCAQIWGGPKWKQEHLCESYNMESWRMCGFLHKFDDLTWRPLFDLRDTKREAALVAKLKTDKPMLLVNVTHAVSSPFPAGAVFLSAIHEAFDGMFNIVNIGGLKLHRIYDLLGLMDAAACMVSIDSAPLHLAIGSSVPVVALVNDEPWLGTKPRGPFGRTFRYHDAMAHPMDVIHAIQSHCLPWPREGNRCVPKSAPPVRRIFHCVERHRETKQNEANRKGIAQKSWDALYAQGVIPCHLDEANYPRTANDIGDTRRLPFLLDVLNEGMALADPDDIIFLTNDDNFLHPQLPDMLRQHISIYEVGCAHRCEFKLTSLPSTPSPPETYVKRGRPHMGRDLFAFTKRWLLRNWNDIPDFVLGCSDWDLCMTCLIRNHFGIKSTRKNIEDNLFPAELPLGYVSHTYHSPAWNHPAYTNNAPGQLHNRHLFKAWADKNAPHLRFDANLCI